MERIKEAGLRIENPAGLLKVSAGLRGKEKIFTEVFETSSSASTAVAREIASGIREKQAEGKNIILGMATGSTPIPVYNELIRMHKEEGLSFKNVITFNLDEYYGLEPSNKMSYNYYMHHVLFDHIDIPKENVNIPPGIFPSEEADKHAGDYENKIIEAGGIDIQILGIGSDGHIGFNEPGSSIKSKTRMVTLNKTTRSDAAEAFNGLQNVPKHALTMGVGTILAARRILIMAFGDAKANVTVDAIEGEVTAQVACTYLQGDPKCVFLLDKMAAQKLSRFVCPWVIHGQEGFVSLNFNDKLTRKAVYWLARKVHKPILRLTEDDYLDNGLVQLLQQNQDSISRINIKVYRQLADTITGWPAGGRPPKDDSIDYYKKRATESKRILVFSPEPHTSVLFMGATLIKLCNQGHQVHMAYQTSGNISVFDYDALRYLFYASEFAREFKFPNAAAMKELEEKLKKEANEHTPGTPYSQDFMKVKGLLRRSEARSAALCCGVQEENIHHQNLPFYEKGQSFSEVDVKMTKELIETIKPQQIYCAGDLGNPLGIQRMCLKAILTSLDQIRKENQAWINDTSVLMYRGSWQEWEPEYITLSIPLSPAEVRMKRMAIFRHESQKDPVPFAHHSDTKQYWMKAEERNATTASLFNLLGLQEYEGIEVFVDAKNIENEYKI